MAQALWEAQFVVVSHGMEENPILNYGNQQGFDLWEMLGALLLQAQQPYLGGIGPTDCPQGRKKESRSMEQAPDQSAWSPR